MLLSISFLAIWICAFFARVLIMQWGKCIIGQSRGQNQVYLSSWYVLVQLQRWYCCYYYHSSCMWCALTGWSCKTLWKEQETNPWRIMSDTYDCEPIQALESWIWFYFYIWQCAEGDTGWLTWLFKILEAFTFLQNHFWNFITCI